MKFETRSSNFETKRTATSATRLTSAPDHMSHITHSLNHSLTHYLFSGVVSFSLFAGASWRSGRLAKSSCSARPIARDRTTIFPSLDTHTNQTSQHHTCRQTKHKQRHVCQRTHSKSTDHSNTYRTHPFHEKERVGERLFHFKKRTVNTLYGAAAQPDLCATVSWEYNTDQF